MKKHILLTLLFTLNISCNRITLIYYGVKNPKIETIESVKKYIKKQNISNYELIFFKNIDELNNFKKEFNELKVPDAYFFNQNGNYVPYKKNAKECNAHVDDFIIDLKNINNDNSNMNINLQSLNHFFVDDDNNNPKIVKGKTIVILSFAKFLGKVNKEHSFEWVKSLEEASKNIDLKVYLLNSDFMNFWDVTNDDLPKIN